MSSIYVSFILAGGTWATADDEETDGGGSIATLSQQELRALVLYAAGVTQEMMAQRMSIASSTVER